MNALTTATQGLQQAMNRFDGHAHQLARLAGGAPVEPAGEIVGLMQAGAAFQANLQTVRRSNEMLGSLLDRWA